MSASLVGSEMCIRDSPPTRGGDSPSEACSKLLHTGECGLKSCYAFVVMPVSYTHLTLPTICSV
eukprot:11005678-Alexandrium_andersonii.AAC.1